MSKETNIPQDNAPTIEPKIRIRLLSPKLRLVSDRLVSQPTEFKKGPSQKWPNPLQIEFTLLDQEDVKGAQEYLGQLALDLPLVTKEKSEGKKYKKKIQLLDAEPIKELFHTAQAKCQTQEEWIEYLRKLDFIFLTTQFISDFKIPIQIAEKHENYQFMVRQVKLAKNPLADKYDHQLAVGFKMTGDKVDKIIIYMYGKFLKKLEVKWGKEKQRTLQKPEWLVFPTYMIEEERIKFSIEHRKLKNDPELKPSKLYLRWKDFVKIK